jgi:hypothetical protein
MPPRASLVRLWAQPQEFGEDRCPHQPRSFRTEDIEDATISALLPVFTRDYLTELAADYLAATTDQVDGTTPRKLNSRLADLHKEKKAIARKLAGEGNLDIWEELVAEIEAEESAIQAQLNDIERRASQQIRADTIEQQIEMLVDGSQDRLTNLTTGGMADLFDLLELDLVRVDAYRFEGTGSIPIRADGGEIWVEPPAREPHPR